MATRTTVILSEEDEHALKRASRREGVSQSELIRRGIRLVTAPFRSARRPSTGWLELSELELGEVASEAFGDFDQPEGE